MASDTLLDALKAAVPDGRDLATMPAEEVAWPMLAAINGREAQVERASAAIHVWNDILSRLEHQASGRWPGFGREAARVVVEAWSWLLSANLLAPLPDDQTGRLYFVTRKGRSVKDAADFHAVRAARALPRELLHPALVREAWPSFVRGQYALAVFAAFHAVEVAVRETGGFEDTMYGVTMVREAFRTDVGRLTDPEAVRGEQEAMQNLFAGALGAYKNAHSHRRVDIADPVEAGELLFIASHLLRVVDTRARLKSSREDG